MTVEDMLALMEDRTNNDVPIHIIRPFLIDLCRRVIALEDAVRNATEQP